MKVFTFMVKTVEPIRDKNILKKIQDYLRDKNYRNYMLFFMGINTGLRISDLLNLKVYDVKDVQYIYLREKKTGKERKIPLFAHVKRELYKYITIKKITGDLFPARYTDENIHRKTAWTFMKDIEREFNLRNLGTHSMRKTFGYHFYKQTNDIATLMTILNHSKEVTTIRYIGMSQDRINKRMKEFKL